MSDLTEVSTSEQDRRVEAPLVVAVPRPEGTPTRTPRLQASGYERVLAGANAAARAGSLARLARWFPGYDFDADAQNTDDRRFAHLPVDPSLVAQVDGMAVLDAIFGRDQIFAEGGLTFSKERKGQGPPPEGVARPVPLHGAVGLQRRNLMEHQERPAPRSAAPYRLGDAAADAVGMVAVGGLTGALRDQWTTVVNGVDRQDAGVAQICADLGRVVGCAVNANAYLSQGIADGFGSNAHWDRQDVIIVQVAGAKEWSVHAPELPAPQTPWIPRSVPTEVIWRGVLPAGEALFIPRGWGHRVHQSEDLSVHFTIGINRLEAHHLLDQAAWEAGTLAEFRADVPFQLDRAATSQEGSLFDGGAAWADAVTSLATSESLDRAVGTFRSNLPMRQFPTFSHTFRAIHHGDWTGLGLQVAAPCGVMVVDGAEDHAVVSYDARVVWLDPVVHDTFARLAAGDPLAFDDLPLDPARRQQFATELVQANLAQVVAMP